MDPTGSRARPLDPESQPATARRPPAAGTWIEIDERALRENIRELRQEFAPAALCMVVKGNAYGHSYDAVVPIAEDEGVRDFAVFSAREAAGFLRASDGASRLQVMGDGVPGNIPWMIQRGLQPWLSDADDWPEVVGAVESDGAGAGATPAPRGPPGPDPAAGPARVHVELETGMNRSGLAPAAAYDVAAAAHDHPNVVLEGICTHLAGAEDPTNRDRVERQQRRFHEFTQRLRDAGITWKRSHVASSAAGLLDPGARLDLVRSGIACYGLWPSPHVHDARQERGMAPVLRNVLSWKSRIVSTKRVGDGDYVGYGRLYEAEGDTTIAVVAVGYGDGFTRGLSNVGHVLVRGRRASIVGAVNMNLIQVNVTHIPEAAAGDEVVLIGRQGRRQISVASFSDFNNIVNYELMARLSWEIPRIVVRGEPLRPPLE